MQAASTDHLFQTDAELAKAAARAAKAQRIAALGRPIALSSKPLDLAVRCDGTEGQAEAWTAESGGVARRVSLESGKTIQVYKGHAGPVTSLAFAKLSQLPFELLITASWDKSIRFWNTQTGNTVRTLHNAHTDFVKCLLVIDKLGILISGGSDKDIRAWDLRSLTHKDTRETSTNCADGRNASPPTFAASLRGSHTRPIEVLRGYEIVKRDKDNPDEAVGTGRFALWSADSMGRICIWQVWRNERGELEHTFKHTWLAHQTAIYDILFLSDGTAWTASGDKSATMWQFDDTSSDTPTAQMSISHPDYVKAVLWFSVPSRTSAAEYIMTACTDESVRIWDATSLASDNMSTPLAAIEGHAHEVNKLKLAHLRNDEGASQLHLISTSLDSTVRRWPLSQIMASVMAKPHEQSAASISQQSTKGNGAIAAMTAEEEAELAELMDD